jgi:UDP-sulfoquinovose synthase
MVSAQTGAQIRYYRNPRKEDSENSLKVCNDNFLKLGLNPITLQNGLLAEVVDIAKKYESRCDRSRIICTSCWTKDISADYKGSDAPVLSSNIKMPSEIEVHPDPIMVSIT